MVRHVPVPVDDTGSAHLELWTFVSAKETQLDCELMIDRHALCVGWMPVWEVFRIAHLLLFTMTKGLGIVDDTLVPRPSAWYR